MIAHRLRPHAMAYFTLACLVPGGRALALEPNDGSFLVQVIGSDFLDRSRDDWNSGLGFGLTTQWRLGKNWDARGDVGGRWYEGALRVSEGEGSEPDWGSRVGEQTDGLQAIPVNAGLVYRFEQWSDGRFWVPYAGVGGGFYDLEAHFLSGESERVHRLYRFGWHVRAGVRLERTSGVFVTLESAVHTVDVPARWTPLYDLALGVGASLPSR